jgi:hypothetical protein
MKTSSKITFAVAVSVMVAQAHAQNRVFYAGDAGAERFNDVHMLSDGTALIAGQADSLAWLPANTPSVTLDASGVSSTATGQIGFILHTSGDFSQILRVVRFPTGSVRDVFKIRSTEVPGSATGDIFISGSRDGGTTNGYYIAKLNANFVSAPPTSLSYIASIEAAGTHKDRQPWDVGGDGKVVYALGLEFDSNWAAIQKLGTNGQPEVVENWTAHWRASNGGEWDGTPASSYNQATPLAYSAIVMKGTRRGSLRSFTSEDYNLLSIDANGNPNRKGKFPDDYYFTQHCELSGTGTCPNTGPGYTNYRIQGVQTQRVGGIVIDRRSNNLYFGYSTKSTLPGGNPDFEPAIVAMSPNGAMRWWDRGYEETTANSSPDQYIDGLAIDYSNDRLVVLGRAHGNNTKNFWQGHQIALNMGASVYQRQFTGTNGNIHYSWLGSYGLADGRVRASTYLGEYVDGTTNYGAALTDPHYAGWPNPNLGWPNFNTTRCGADAAHSGEIAIDSEGKIAVSCLGRRTFTTADAFISMPRPNQSPLPSSAWNQFVRVYNSDFSQVVYSSLIVGPWDQRPAVDGGGAGGNNTQLAGLAFSGSHIVAVGMHKADTANATLAMGGAVPTASVPAWGQSTPQAQTALLARLTGTRMAAAVTTEFRNGFE